MSNINVNHPTPPAFSGAPPSSSPSPSREEAVRAVIAANPSKGQLVVQEGAASTEEKVTTPFGKRPISNVHKVPIGGRITHVGNEVHIIDSNDKVIHRAVPGDTVPRLPESSGWITYASWYYNGSPPIQDFITTWTVPPNPATNNNQTIFLFNSIEPASFNAILQPVLQWGPSYAGGGAYWTIASWYLVGSQVYVSTLSSVSVGQVLTGVINLSSYSGTLFNYTCYFGNIGSSYLVVTGAAQLVWATETLESYGVTKSSDYPSGSTPFSAIYLWLTNNTYPSLSWSVTNDIGDGLSTTVNVDGPYNGKVTINYPT